MRLKFIEPTLKNGELTAELVERGIQDQIGRLRSSAVVSATAAADVRQRALLWADIRVLPRLLHLVVEVSDNDE